MKQIKLGWIFESSSSTIKPSSKVVVIVVVELAVLAVVKVMHSCLSTFPDKETHFE